MVDDHGNITSEQIASMGYKSLEEYSKPNYGEAINDGIAHAQVWPDPQKGPEQLRIKPEAQDKPAAQTPDKPVQPISDTELQELGIDKTDARAFRQLNLNAEQARQVLELHKNAVERQTGELSALNDQWVSSLQEEYGEHLPDVADQVNDLLKRHDRDGELVALLKKTGTQNCGPLFRMLHSVARENRRHRH